MTEPQPGQEILRAIREGNVTAFKQIFDACYESLCDYAFTILKDEAEAEDIVQSMFVKLWERRAELDIQTTARSYLFRAVYNQCLNLLEHRTVKRKHHDHHMVVTETVQRPEVFVDELEDNIRKVVDKLPPQCKTIFILSRFEELRYAEIAEKLNISVNTIQNQICKALKIIREELNDTL